MIFSAITFLISAWTNISIALESIVEFVLTYISPYAQYFNAFIPVDNFVLPFHKCAKLISNICKCTISDKGGGGSGDLGQNTAVMRNQG